MSSEIYLWVMKTGSNRYAPLKEDNGSILGAPEREGAMALYRRIMPYLIDNPLLNETDFYLGRATILGSEMDPATLKIVGALLFIKPDCVRAEAQISKRAAP